MGKNFQDLRIMAGQGSYIAGGEDNYPMSYVNWKDVAAFCTTLCKM